MMESYVSRLEQDNARLRAALRVYANRQNWEHTPPCPAFSCNTWRGPHHDGPRIAKRALYIAPPERIGPLLSAAALDEDDGAMPDNAIWWGGALRQMGMTHGGGT